VLDSPVVDWLETLQYQAELMRLPAPLTRAALETLAAPWGGRVTGLAAPLDLAVMDFVARADALTVPVLLMHSDDDGFVPPDAARALAAARPDIVTYVPFQTARHTKIWNYDEERWRRTIADWLRQLA
jgi:pimeloyl-ACP methyl ester carboxylesterase